MSDVAITYDYIRHEAIAGRMGSRLMAVVAEGDRGRVYLPPTDFIEAVALETQPSWVPDLKINYHPRDIKTQMYGLTTYGDLFSHRQLVALNAFLDLLDEVQERILNDADLGSRANKAQLDGSTEAEDYARSIKIYLAFAISKLADRGSTICSWDSSPKMEALRNTFGRQAIPMTWDFAEGNPFSASSGNWLNNVDWCVKVVANLPGLGAGHAIQSDAMGQEVSRNKIISTDPPYYDNIGYADLSDFFYVWLRRSLRTSFPELFATLAVPKAEELVATPYRHGSKEKADAFFLDGMTHAMRGLTVLPHPGFPATIYYAFKQSETQSGSTASTGWETFLDAVIQAGFSITGTWPVRTELSNRMIGSGNNALASSIILVCRPREANATTATRRDFLNTLKSELPEALRLLQHGNIAPVDLAQAAIGPGMAVYTRYARVLDAAGTPLTVRQALALINETLDEVLAEQEGDFDADTRWAVGWFDQYGFAEGEYGVAETLSTAKNTSVGGMVDAGIISARGGRVRLLRPDELPPDWVPGADPRLTIWEIVHQLIRRLEAGGESAAANLLAQLDDRAEVARELAYRLYTLCERKKRAAEALSYNGLVQSWPEISRLAVTDSQHHVEQSALFD